MNDVVSIGVIRIGCGFMITRNSMIDKLNIVVQLMTECHEASKGLGAIVLKSLWMIVQLINSRLLIVYNCTLFNICNVKSGLCIYNIKWRV